MKMIKRLLKRYTPPWVLAISFLVVMMIFQIVQDITDRFRGENI